MSSVHIAVHRDRARTGSRHPGVLAPRGDEVAQERRVADRGVDSESTNSARCFWTLGGRLVLRFACAAVTAALVGCTRGDFAASEANRTSDTNGLAGKGTFESSPARPEEESLANHAPLDADVRRSVVEGIAQRLASDYVFESVAARMANLLGERLEGRFYDAIEEANELASVLTRDLRAIAHDKHLNVGYRPPGSGVREPGVAYGDTGIRKLEVLAGNVGYVELDGLPMLEVAQRAVEGLFAVLQRTDALIIDNRNNAGGDPRTAAWYVSYLSEGAPFVVSETRDRSGAYVRQAMTTDVGARSYGKERPVYVLTSARTFSAGENLTYALQALGRATVIGEVTGGGAHPTRRFSLGHGFIVGVPFAETVSAITGTNWEGVGVKPDVPMPPEHALQEAERRAREDIATATALRVARGEPPPRYGLNQARRGAPKQEGARVLPLENGDFSSGMAAWGVSGGPRTPNFGIRGGALCVNITARDRVLVGWPPETADHSVALEAGERYQLSFQAVATNPQSLDAEVAVAHRLPPYTQIVGAQIPLDATRQSFTVDFEPDSDEPEGGIVFRVAVRSEANPSELCIDDVAIREVQH
jgi:retinol-binding protein 3